MPRLHLLSCVRISSSRRATFGLELATVLQSHTAAWKEGRYANGRTLLDVYFWRGDRGRLNCADCRCHCPNHSKIASCYEFYSSGRQPCTWPLHLPGEDRFGSESRLVTFSHLPHPKKRIALGAAVKSLSKVAVVTLALVFAAVQVTACALPGRIATPAERMCCTQMADRCGQAGMADSHSCCKASPTNSLAFRASTPQSSNFSPLVVQVLTVAAESSAVSRAVTLSFLYTRSPPHLRFLTTIVLRI